MTGIVDVGGGMRGVFSAGIYDRFIEEGINFDLCIGVSAGSANLISYAAGHHDRVKRFYVNYAQRKQYMSFDNFIHSGSYIGLDYIYSTISNSDGEDPLNYDAFTANHTDFITVVTDGETGEPIYFPKNSIKRDDLTVIKASCCLPAVCKPIVIDGKDCFDDIAASLGFRVKDLKKYNEVPEDFPLQKNDIVYLEKKKKRFVMA